jgi:putative SOS response-associated peptidase YedK
MCGRYSLAGDPEHIKEHYALSILPAEVQPRYNIAPTNKVLTVRLNEERANEAAMARWGFVPLFARTVEDARKRAMINIRSEDAMQRGYLKRAFTVGRILLPATGFYEWQKRGKEKVPHLIRRADHDIMSLAGLRTTWKNPETGDEIETVAILTTQPNEIMRPLHDRMPLILSQDDEATWLDPEVPMERVAELMAPCPSGWLMVQAVPDLVNSVKNEGPDLIAPREEG